MTDEAEQLFSRMKVHYVKSGFHPFKALSHFIEPEERKAAAELSAYGLIELRALEQRTG